MGPTSLCNGTQVILMTYLLCITVIQAATGWSETGMLLVNFVKNLKLSSDLFWWDFVSYANVVLKLLAVLLSPLFLNLMVSIFTSWYRIPSVSSAVLERSGPIPQNAPISGSQTALAMDTIISAFCEFTGSDIAPWLVASLLSEGHRFLKYGAGFSCSICMWRAFHMSPIRCTEPIFRSLRICHVRRINHIWTIFYTVLMSNTLVMSHAHILSTVGNCHQSCLAGVMWNSYIESAGARKGLRMVFVPFVCFWPGIWRSVSVC